MNYSLRRAHSLAPLRRRAGLIATLAMSGVGIAAALPASAAAAQNTASAPCNTFVNEECHASVTVNRGAYTVEFTFSNGKSATGNETCSSATCTQGLASVPPKNTSVVNVFVTGNDARDLSTF